ncbi:hypothetical protein [Miltoncostaea marina]|uniref:hypothetical protein n=1 Tax=Miltoncostaea marina TaxID=2843215 RepID=UPI001C3C4500|nr:hypothetical protein [Miltoncostaea marina]
MTAAERALEHLGFLAVDATSDALLAALVGAWMTGFERAGEVAHGDGELPPWRILTDPAVAPLWALPHAAQWTGGRMPPRRGGETDADYLARARREVVYPRGMRRGSALIAVETAREHLTGERSVIFREGHGGDPWLLMLVTRIAETPDADALRAAVAAVLPAGVVLDHEVRDARDWQLVADTWPDWAAVEAANPTWQQVLEVPDP